MGDWQVTAAIVAIAYLIGSIPFGLLLTRAAGLGDIRKVGSGNIGATNVLRTGNKGLAALTLVLDGAKGAVAVLLALRFGPELGVIAAAMAVIGHVFPVWLKFCGTWLLVAAVFRYSSLAALVAVAAAPAYAWFLADHQRGELAIFVAALVWLRHHQNIRRLLKGEEPKIGGDKKPAEQA
jgi:glycerol-3-phosphate acyltransferase PlsY